MITQRQLAADKMEAISGGGIALETQQLTAGNELSSGLPPQNLRAQRTAEGLGHRPRHGPRLNVIT